jgi:hypothetical protein
VIEKLRIRGKACVSEGLYFEIQAKGLCSSNAHVLQRGHGFGKGLDIIPEFPGSIYHAINNAYNRGGAITVVTPAIALSKLSKTTT